MLGHNPIMKSKTTFFILLSVGLILATVGVFFRPVHAQTWVEGHITTDTTWTVADSPYRAINDVIVDPGVLLTIEPGVEVQFADGFSLVIEGSLNASGTESNPIIFTSSRVAKDSPDPYPGAWNTIKFIGTNNAYFTMRHCVVEYATNGIVVQSTAKARITNCAIMNNFETGILVINESNTSIRQSTLVMNKNGIGISGAVLSGLEIFGNVLSSNEVSGMNSIGSISNIQDIILQDNTVYDNNGDGISLLSSDDLCNVTIVDNAISLNAGNGIRLKGRSVHDINVSSNNISLCQESGILLQGSTRIDYHDSAFLFNITIVDNDVSKNQRKGISLQSSFYGTYGIGATYGEGRSFLYDVLVSGNNVDSNIEDGIWIQSKCDAWDSYSYAYNVTVSGNNIRNNHGNGVDITSIASLPCVQCSADTYGYLHSVLLAFNNVFSNYKNGIYMGVSGTSTRNIFSRGTVSLYNVEILENNVFFNGENGVYISSSAPDSSTFHTVNFSKNSLFVNGANGLRLSSSEYLYNVSISYNSISSNIEDGIQVTGSHKALPFDIWVFRNKVSANNRAVFISGEIKTNITSNSISYSTFGILYEKSKNNSAERNDIYHNHFGMYVTPEATVNAEYNYWGHSTGPYHESLNFEGEGNPVNGDGKDLDFIPFLTSPLETINQRPVAILEVDKTNPNVDETVTFDASASTDDGRIDYYFFDFGDGKNSGWTTFSVIKHNYTSVGVYNANLTVMDDFGVKSTNAVTITITVTQQLQTLTVSLTLNPTVLNSGTSVSVQVHVTNGTSPVKDAQVQLFSDKGGTFTPQSGYTNSNGYFTSTFTAPTVTTQTTITITANATKTGYLSGQGQTQITVNPSPSPEEGQPYLPLWVILAVIVIILVITVSIVAITRRKKTKT